MNLREKLAEPFGGLRKDTLDELETVVKDCMIDFTLFCAENYIPMRIIGEVVWDGNKNQRYTTEQLMTIYLKQKSE